MKIVREGLYTFFKSGDIKDSLQIGIKSKIEKWLKDHYVNNYSINKDGKIDIHGDLVLVNLQIEAFPEYIKFGKVYGGFYGHGNNWNSLNGFPDEVHGDFELHAPWEPRSKSQKIFTEEEILRKIDIFGNIWV